MEHNEVIKRISFFRTKANLSARALSLKTDLNAGYINRLESKKDFLPSLEVLLNIVEACGITEEEFFYHDISAYETDMKALDILKGLNEKKKQALTNFLNTIND